MAKKFFSLILVPHARARSKTLTISKKTFRVALGGTIVFFLLLIGFLIDYFSMSVTRAKYRNLRSENQIQKKQIADNDKTLNQMKSQIQKFETYVKKLSTMAGLKSADLLKEAGGIGGGDNTDVPEGYAPDPAPDEGQRLAPPNIQSLSLKTETLDKKFSSLIVFYENQTAMLAGTPTTKPVHGGYLSSYFGMRDDPFTGQQQFHSGIDIACDVGTPVTATADGVVLSCAAEGNGGKTITISHTSGITTKYLHLNNYLARNGQRVKRGDVIGEVGKTGRVIGPHLHYEVRVNGQPQNPRNFILEDNFNF